MVTLRRHTSLRSYQSLYAPQLIHQMSNSAKQTNELSQQLIQQMAQLCDENYSSEVQRIVERFGYDAARECEDHVSNERYEKSFEKKFEEMDWKVKIRAIQQLATCGMHFELHEKEMNEMKEQVRRMEREVREMKERVREKEVEFK